MKRARLLLKIFLPVVMLPSGLLCCYIRHAQTPADKPAPTPGPMLSQGIETTTLLTSR